MIALLLISFFLPLAQLLTLFPKPQYVSLAPQPLKLQSPCQIFSGDISSLSQNGQPLQYYFSKIMSRLNNKKPCPASQFLPLYHVKLILREEITLSKEAYIITTNQKEITIKYSDYNGYVYSLETLYQMLRKGLLYLGTIRDLPYLQYRGIMVDSARHFLDIQTLKRLVQSMPIAKLNMLHWHMVDDQSFPFQLQSHPELSQAGAYSNNSVYTIEMIKQLLALAKLNAISIIPEIDSPGHSRSWGLSQKWKQLGIDIHCNGGEGYNGQLDLSKPETYQLASEIYSEMNYLFKDSPYLHLGGDEVSSACWDLRPDIKKFMSKKSIKDYGELQMYWRLQIKQSLSQGRRSIYWSTSQNVKTGPEDIVQYWGIQANAKQYAQSCDSQLILSPSDILYFNKGHGNIWLNSTFGNYPVWLDIYNNFVPIPEGVDPSRILGAEACLWGEQSNDATLQNNLWMRAAAFASRVWSQDKQKIPELTEALMELQQTLQTMGNDVSPLLPQYCEIHPKQCMMNAQNEEESKGKFEEKVIEE